MVTKPTGRPRGRPKGAKNIPKIEEFVAETIAGPVPVPPLKPKGKPRGPWAGMTPEERSAYSQKLRASREGKSPGRGVAGKPLHMTKASYEARHAEQIPIVKRIMAKMAKDGILPEDDQAREALENAMIVMRTQDDAKTKLAAARLVLDFTKAKPTTKVEHTIKSAEEYLDDIAEE